MLPEVNAEWPVRRREFVQLIGGAAVSAWSDHALAQPSKQQPTKPKVATIGFLNLGPASGYAEQTEAFRSGLRDLGYIDGDNIRIVFRWAREVSELPDLAAELVKMNVEVIVAPNSTAVEPARKATRTIPIVFTQHADPVGVGHVMSLAHPGGNITGISMLLPEMVVKGFEILLEAIRSGHKICILPNPTTPSHPPALEALKSAAKTRSISLVIAPIQNTDDIEEAFRIMMRERVDGFLVPSSPLTNTHPVLLAQLELKNRLPGMFVNKENVQAGGLMSYGANFNYMYRHAASYIDKILKGETPADLPVEQASKYELVINLKTAKAIGFDIPPTLFARADEVIE